MLCFIFLSFYLFIFLITVSSVFGQYQLEYDIIEPELPSRAIETQVDYDHPGAMYLPSVMTSSQYLRVLFVFVQFKDDALVLNDNLGWPLNQRPTTWMGTNMVDPNTSTNSTNYNLTHYYNVMSMNKFKMIGDCYYIKTPNTRQQYIQMGFKYGDINQQLLTMLDDSLNYDLYDKWDKNAIYTNIWGMDDEIDMIVMIYRNIDNELVPYGKVAYQLGFGGRSIIKDSTGQFDTTYSKWSGICGLGESGEFWVEDEMKKIDLDVWHGSNSGVTVAYGYNGLSMTRNVIVHEIGHHFFGTSDPHVPRGAWGIMSTYGGRSQMVNSRERHWLNWVTAKQYDYNPTAPIVLGDYLTTGDALRIKIPGLNKYYYLENHQRTSGLDNIDRTIDGKGVYVLYQHYNFEGGTLFYNAQGRFNWTKYGMAYHPTCFVDVPVALRKAANNNGYFCTDEVYSYPEHYRIGSIEAYRDTVNDRNLFHPLFLGYGSDAMKPGYVDVFNQYSNPSLNNVAFQVVSENNQIKIKQYVAAGTLLSTPPARPQNLKIHIVNRNPVLTWDANTDPDVIGNTTKRGKYKVYRGTAYMPNNLIAVPEINYSYLGYVNHPTTTYTDEDYTITGGGLDKVFYKIAAVDTTNLESTKSEFDSVRFDWRVQKQNNLEETLTYELKNNYPNPFNPTTTIKYEIPENAYIELKVFDVLGREVEQLVGNYQTAGKYMATFNAEGLTSGIYIYQLKANNYLFTKKMVLLK